MKITYEDDDGASVVLDFKTDYGAAVWIANELTPFDLLRLKTQIEVKLTKFLKPKSE